MKECNQCNKSKSLNEFYKRSASPDGLQFKCKECCKVVNTNFRQIKPQYQTEWYKVNTQKWAKYVAGWAKVNIKADDSRSAIYYIINPEQKVYVGSTQTAFSARKGAHKKEYKLNNGLMPNLHHSFDMYGWDTHKWVIIDMAGMDRDTLRTLEYTMINHYNKLGMSLNKRLK